LVKKRGKRLKLNIQASQKLRKTENKMYFISTCQESYGVKPENLYTAHVFNLRAYITYNIINVPIMQL
jgi:hypothetical protein